MTKEDTQDRCRKSAAKRWPACPLTGDDNIDKAQQQLAKIQGPNRIIAELSMAKLDRAVYSQRQLEAVMEDFWFNHFNVFANKGADRWLAHLLRARHDSPAHHGQVSGSADRHGEEPGDAFLSRQLAERRSRGLRSNGASRGWRARRFQGIFRGGFPPMPGEFPRPGAGIRRTLPAHDAQQQQERGLNENYGREVMELHTVGVDAGYTQQDVIEMAKCLTGWTIREPRRDPEYMFRPEFHAQGKKVVMGHTFDYGGEKDGEEALKMLANDPHTAASSSPPNSRAISFPTIRRSRSSIA